jgi:branched-subunit amino acid transport protein
MSDFQRQFITVLLMASVTFLPRLIPMTLLRGKKLNPTIQNFLKCVPFAVLGALIFPEVLHSTDSIPSAAIGFAAAIVFAFMRFNVVFVILGSIAAVYISSMAL